MKKLPILFIVALAIISACSGSKNMPLDKDPLLRIEDPYWFKVMPGQEDAEKFSVLILPVVAVLESYQPDSVYFRGYHEHVKLSGMDGKSVYRAQLFEKSQNDTIKPPYDLDDDQALMSYLTSDSVKRYILIENIIQGETIFMP